MVSSIFLIDYIDQSISSEVEYTRILIPYTIINKGILVPQVKFFGILRQYTGSSELAFPGETVRNVLQELCARNPELCAAIYTTDQTDLSPHLRIMLNGRDINMLQGVETPVGESDTLAIIPPIAGGFS